MFMKLSVAPPGPHEIITTIIIVNEKINSCGFDPPFLCAHLKEQQNLTKNSEKNREPHESICLFTIVSHSDINKHIKAFFSGVGLTRLQV